MAKMAKRSRILFLCLLNFAVVCIGSQNSGSMKKQSFTVDETQIDVKLLSDKPSVMLGEPVYLSFVVENHSDHGLQIIVGGDYRNALGRPESFSATVLSEAGKKVSQPDAGPSFGGITGPQKIPAQGSYIFRLFLPDWAIFTESGRYSITFRRELNINGYGDEWMSNSNARLTKLNKEATVAVEIAPTDKQKMGTIIDTLGNELLDKNNPERDITARSLNFITDNRAIPYYVQAFDSDNSQLKIIALRALAKFDDEAAFQILKRGMTTQAADIHDASGKGFEEDVANNIRQDAANSLASSKYSESRPYLLGCRSDKYSAVRITILHVLGKMDPAIALPILREMTADSDNTVRDEAKRYVKLQCERIGGQDPVCGKQ